MKWDAERYDAVKAPQMNAGRELIELAKVRATDTILDVGCGTGKLTVELARLSANGRVIGVEPSEEMMIKAKKTCASDSNISLLHVSAEDINYRDTFDLVFSNSVMQWIKDQEHVLDVIYSALKEGGRFAFQMPARNFCKEFRDYIKEAIQELGLSRAFAQWNSPWFFPTEDEYDEMLRRAGFKDVRAYVKEYEVRFPTINETVEWWNSAGLRPFLAELDRKGKRYFTYAVAMRFEGNRNAGDIQFKFRRLFAFGRK